MLVKEGRWRELNERPSGKGKRWRAVAHNRTPRRWRAVREAPWEVGDDLESAAMEVDKQSHATPAVDGSPQ